MYDSPLEWCSRCKDWVALDQTVEDCAKQHCCRDSLCPMAAVLGTPQSNDPPPDLKRGVPLI